MPRYTLHVNGRDHAVEADDAETPLLYVLRNDLSLHGPKFGCGLGQCGACMVLVDGSARRACLLALKDAAGKRITTLEGLGTPEKLDPVQAAFLAEQAAQCGYCSNGMIIAARALLNRVPHPTEQLVRTELAANLCRCGSHDRVLRAVLRAARGA